MQFEAQLSCWETKDQRPKLDRLRLMDVWAMERGLALSLVLKGALGTRQAQDEPLCLWQCEGAVFAQAVLV